MTAIKVRIIQVLEIMHVPKEEFYKKIGMTSANFRGKAKNTPLNSDAIANVLSVLPDLDARWLITGEGEMLIGKSSEETVFNVAVKEKDARIEDLKKQLSDKDEYIKHLLALLDKADKKLPDASSAVNVIGHTDAQTPPLPANTESTIK